MSWKRMSSSLTPEGAKLMNLPTHPDMLDGLHAKYRDDLGPYLVFRMRSDRTESK